VIDFQAESTKSGGEFETQVYDDLVLRQYPNIAKNVFILEAGIEIDFVSENNYIEAKGGNSGGNKRPGAKRTDNVKKAIANGSLLKAIYPNAFYIVYFSEKPDAGLSSEIMINLALAHNIIDEVRYLEKSGEAEDTPQYTLDIDIT
jgi:hypothetical protein